MKERGGRKERERERERGAVPPSPSPIRTPPREGARPLLAAALSLPPGPIIPPGGSVNPPGTPVNSETFHNTSGVEYSRPIYQSLCLGHSETPRHVRNLIRDSELPSVHQNS